MHHAYLQVQAESQVQRDQTDQNLADLCEVQRILSVLSQKMSEFVEDSTSKLTTIALRDVFFDEILSLEVKNSVIRGKPSVEFVLHDQKRRFSGDPMDSFGGGPRFLIGLILRVIAIVRQPSLARFLVLDEPLIQVSGSYLEKAAALIRRLCDPVDQGGLNFTILVITHNTILKNAAHQSYYATTGLDGESLALETKFPEELPDGSQSSQFDFASVDSGSAPDGGGTKGTAGTAGATGASTEDNSSSGIGGRGGSLALGGEEDPPDD
jgi:hypothetical protein